MKTPEAHSGLDDDAVVSDGRGPTLLERARTLTDAIGSLVAHPDRSDLSEQQRSQSLAMLRKLVAGIAIDIDHFLGRKGDDCDRLWDLVKAAGFPVTGLPEYFLSRLFLWELGNTDRGHEMVGMLAIILDTPPLADAWMRYCIADRRLRDGRNAPVLAISDLPLELQAMTVDMVAGGLMAIRKAEGELESYRSAAKATVALHREETNIAVAATRLVDKALASHSLDTVVKSLLDTGAWGALATLVSGRLATDPVTGTLYLATASSEALSGALIKAGFAPNTAEALVAGRSVDHRIDTAEADEYDAGFADDHSVTDPIAASFRRYRKRS